jgi:D-erythro-7,8-dihydroneopterin triphosphate epimerase
MDQVHIRDLRLRCIVGIKPEERVTKQDVIVNVTLDCDLARSGRTDRLEDTVNFRKLEARIAALVEESRYQLIERLAQVIADLCLEDSEVREVMVSVDKPRALRFARSAAVEIHRARRAAGRHFRKAARA